MLNVLDYVPVVGTVKNVVEAGVAIADGDYERAFSKGAEAAVSGTLDCLSFGAGGAIGKAVAKGTGKIVLKEAGKSVAREVAGVSAAYAVRYVRNRNRLPSPKRRSTNSSTSRRPNNHGGNSSTTTKESGGSKATSVVSNGRQINRRKRRTNFTSRDDSSAADRVRSPKHRSPRRPLYRNNGRTVNTYTDESSTADSSDDETFSSDESYRYDTSAVEVSTDDDSDDCCSSDESNIYDTSAVEVSTDDDSDECCSSDESNRYDTSAVEVSTDDDSDECCSSDESNIYDTSAVEVSTDDDSDECCSSDESNRYETSAVEVSTDDDSDECCSSDESNRYETSAVEVSTYGNSDERCSLLKKGVYLQSKGGKQSSNRSGQKDGGRSNSYNKSRGSGSSQTRDDKKSMSKSKQSGDQNDRNGNDKNIQWRRSKRGDHVINLGVIKFYKKIIEKFIAKRGLEYSRLEKRGFICSPMQLFADYHNPLPEEMLNAIENELVVSSTNHHDSNAAIFGDFDGRLERAVLDYMDAVHELNKAVLNFESSKDTTSLDYFIDRKCEAKQKLSQMIEEMITEEIFVDETALDYWLVPAQARESKRRKKQFEKLKKAVQEMLRALVDKAEVWVEEITEIVENYFNSR